MGNASGLAGEFIEYIMSSEGQEIVGEEGFVPLPTRFSTLLPIFGEVSTV
jgi:ABC-type phosphate transport system substrate-binding protein